MALCYHYFCKCGGVVRVWLIRVFNKRLLTSEKVLMRERRQELKHNSPTPFSLLLQVLSLILVFSSSMSSDSISMS
jgi:hypothetical protein